MNHQTHCTYNRIGNLDPCTCAKPATPEQLQIATEYENGYISLNEAILKLQSLGLDEYEARELLFT